MSGALDARLAPVSAYSGLAKRMWQAMKSIWLENFRCFRERQRARLAPLTLLVGDNSTGKTSFLAMIRALWDVGYRDRVPNFKEEPYDLGSFDEIAHFRGGRGGRAESFEAGFEVVPSSTPACHWSVAFSRRGTAPLPAKRRLANEEEDSWIEHDLRSSRALVHTPMGHWESDVPLPDLEGDRLLSLLLVIDMDHMQKPDIQQLVRSLGAWSYSQPLYAGSPVRSKPHRTYDPSFAVRDPEGDYVPMYLANQYFGGKEHWDRLREDLQRFGKDAGLFDEITVKPLGKQSGPFQLQIRRFDGRMKGPQRNLIDVGYGVSQVLPVVIELLRQDAPPMFLLQQPEVHLHPSAQAALGSLFCRIADWKRQIIIETHSDHLLDRVRMDVRDGAGALKPEDVSILYFERRGLSVRIHSLRIDGDGNVLDAPRGYRRFFMDEVRRSLWKREAGD